MKATMLPLPTKHPGYSSAAELLCTIPREPCYARLVDLMVDFGLDHQRAVWAALSATVRQFSDTGIMPDDKSIIHADTFRGIGQVAYIPANQWQRAQDIGQDYWARVHGGNGKGTQRHSPEKLDRLVELIRRA